MTTTTQRRRAKRRSNPWLMFLAALLAVALFGTACGGGSDSADGGDTDTETTDEGDAGDEGGDDDGEDAGEVVEADDVAEGDVAEGDVDTEVTDENVSTERSYGGDIAIGLEADAPGLRPWEDSWSSPVYNIGFTIFDKLMERGADGVSYEGWLAESIEPNEDFTQWTMKLREGVEFHNGEPLNAQTIVDMFAIQQTGSQSGGQMAAAQLTGVEAVDEYTVTYTLGGPNSAFPAWLERAPLGAVFEPKAAADPEAFTINPIGTGPFKMESRDIDNETVVVRNENYWLSDPEGNQLPFLDSISFRPIPDEGSRLDALLSGTVDAMQTLRQGTIRDAREAASGGEFSLYEFQGSNAGGGMFNQLKAPYDDIRVRQGLLKLNDQTAVIEALGGTGISLPATQWNAPDSPWYSDAAADAYVTFDYEGGKALLDEYVNDPERTDGKGAGEPIELDLACPPDPTLTAAMQVFQAAVESTELATVNLTSPDQATHINNAVTDNFGMNCWRFRDDNDPATYVTAQTLPPTPEIAEAAGLPGVVSPVNWSNWFSPEALGAAQAALSTDDQATRKASYDEISRLINENSAIWFSGHTASMIATQPDLVGLVAWHMPSGNVGTGVPNAEGHWGEIWLEGGGE